MFKIIPKSSLSVWYCNNNNFLPNICNVYTSFKSQIHSTQKSMTPTLNVNPRVCLHNVKPSIRVEGLEHQKPITLKAQMKDDKGKLLYSNAHYVADENGVVDVSVSPSINGSYKGVFPTGLLSSLKFAPGVFPYGNIYKKDMHEPVKIKISLLDGHKPIEVDEGELDSVELHRHLIAKGVQRIPVREGRIRGVLYIPEGDGPFPGVIDMFGASVALFENRAALNAARGIASLALAYFNYDDIPAENIFDPDLSYVEEAIEYLLSHPKVKPDRCGAIGNCFGGFLSYYTGLHVSKLKAIFLINSSFNLMSGVFKYKGKIVATSPYKNEIVLQQDDDGLFISTEMYKQMFCNVQQHQIDEFNRTLDDQHFVVAIGSEETYRFYKGWDLLIQQLSENKKKNITLKVYPGGGHLLSPPYTPVATVANTNMFIPRSEVARTILINYGGENQGVVRMQEDVWQWMYDFFQKHLGDKQ